MENKQTLSEKIACLQTETDAESKCKDMVAFLSAIGLEDKTIKNAVKSYHRTYLPLTVSL